MSKPVRPPMPGPAPRSAAPKPVSSRSSFVLGGLAVLVIAAVIGLVWATTKTTSEVPVQNDGYGPVHNPAVTVSLQPDGSQLLGLPTAAKTIDLYEDPLCPYCGQVEKIYGQQLAQYIDQGKIAVRYHLLNFLNKSSSSGNYSSRADAAFRCLAQDGNGPRYGTVHSQLFGVSQPKEGGQDHASDQLADIIGKVGAPPEVVTCVSNNTQLKDAETTATAAATALGKLNNGQVGTPAAYLGNTKLDVNDERWVSKAAG